MLLYNKPYFWSMLPMCHLNWFLHSACGVGHFCSVFCTIEHHRWCSILSSTCALPARWDTLSCVWLFCTTKLHCECVTLTACCARTLVYYRCVPFSPSTGPQTVPAKGWCCFHLVTPLWWPSQARELQLTQCTLALRCSLHILAALCCEM